MRKRDLKGEGQEKDKEQSNNTDKNKYSIFIPL